VRHRSRSFAVASGGRTVSGGLDAAGRERLRALGVDLSGASDESERDAENSGGGESGVESVDGSVVSDLAERSEFTPEQVRDMTDRQREQLAETLDDLAAADVTGNVGALASLSGREESRERPREARRAAGDESGEYPDVGVLSSLSANGRRHELPRSVRPGRDDYPDVGALASVAEREAEARERAERVERRGTDGGGDSVGALTTLSARETSRERSGASVASGPSEDVEEYTASVGAIATAAERERGER
jgi:hypothetical protein